MMWTTRLAIGTLALLGYATRMVEAYSGELTWYHANQHGNVGACGQAHYDGEYVVAVAYGTYDSYGGGSANPNNNAICRQNIKATYQGKSVVAKVVDRCGDCHNAGNIDMSPTAFQALADLSAGRLYGVEWEFTSESPGPASGGGRKKVYIADVSGATDQASNDDNQNQNDNDDAQNYDHRDDNNDDNDNKNDKKHDNKHNKHDKNDNDNDNDLFNFDGSHVRTAIPSLALRRRSSMGQGLATRLGRRFREALQKREWLQKDH